jgi:protein-L-isoaspartate(D-aspartate) O-methyltransferase
MADLQDSSAGGNGFHRLSGPTEGDYALRRGVMVERQLRKRGIRDERVLAAMLSVPRHEFVPPESAGEAYDDRPLAIGHGQTISQPFMVAAMAEALQLSGSERLLEIGAGSGYQAAVLSLLARQVQTVETQEELAIVCRQRLQRLGYDNVRVHVGDGTLGWADQAPYEAIVVTAAAPEIPPPLVAQLAEGGRLLVPVGTTEEQQLQRVEKRGAEIVTRALHHCRFVPLIGQYGWKPRSG